MEDEQLGLNIKLSARRKTLAALILILALLASILASLAAAALVAPTVSSPWSIFVAGLLAAALLMGLLAYVAARILRRQHPVTFAGKASVLTVFTLCVVTLTVLFPHESKPSGDGDVAVPFENWELSTGTRAAVRVVTARKEADLPPIVFLHGGPGAYSVSLEPLVSVLGQLADDGYSVYFYDQVGGGLSSRLPEITAYTLDRHVADLNAIIQRIDSGPVILIGSSFGASLAASYLAQHPDDVAAAVVSGSAPMFYPHYAKIGDGKIDEKLNEAQKARMREMVETPRVFAALALAAVNPNAAARFATDRELGHLFDRVANEIYLPATVCPGNEVAIRSQGYGFWSNQMTSRTLIDQSYDPRPDLATSDVPVLVIRGSCDYKKEAVAREYVEVFPVSQFVAMPDAGHMPYLEQPALYLKHVRQFLGALDVPGAR